MKRSKFYLKEKKGFGRARIIAICFIIALSLHLSAINAQPFLRSNLNPINDEDVIRVKTNFSVPIITEIIIGGEIYNRVTINGLMNAGNPGEPVLPVKTLKILIPIDKEIASTSIEYDAEQLLDGMYLIEPGQRQLPLRNLNGYEEIKPERSIYGSCQDFHKEPYNFITQQKISGYRIAVYNLYPVTYKPETGVLSYFKSLTLVINLRPSNEVLNFTRYRVAVNKGNTQVINRIKKFVDNPDIESVLSSYNRYRSLHASAPSDLPSDLSDTGPYEYIIITDQSFEDAFQRLIDSKIKKGITARTVNTQWIYENYDGTRPDGDVDDQTKIRNFIRDAHNYWDTQYVLLGGDADADDVGGESGDVIVPCRILYDTIFGEYYPDEAHITSDLYYACLDGTFDYNQNGIYGETDDGEDGGEVDLLAEVFVGRAPVDSIEEVSNFVHKTLAHEKSNPSEWKNKMVGEDMFPWQGIARYALNYLEEIRLGSNEHSYSTLGIEASSIESHVLYDSPDYSWNVQTLIDSMNDTGTHYYNHLGHSNIDYNMKMSNKDVDGLTNEVPFFVYSQGCYSASFDNMGTYEFMDIIYTDTFKCDCIAEHFVNNPFGAFAYIGNTRYGFGLHYSTDGASQHFHRCFWDDVIGQGIRQLGRANQKSKEDNIGFITYDNPIRWCYFQITLLGDPEISLGNFIFDNEKPSEPTNLIASDGTYNNHVELEWNHSYDSTCYMIFRNEAYDSESASYIKLVSNPEINNGLIQTIDDTGDPNKTYFYWVKACNGNKKSDFCKAHEVFIDIPPVANAGKDRTIKVGSKTDRIDVTLNGSSSYDPNGSILTYEWSLNGNIIAQKEKTIFTLGVEKKTFTLKVSNGKKSNSDSVIITVKVKNLNGGGIGGGLFGGYYNSYNNIFLGTVYNGGYSNGSFGNYNIGFLGGYPIQGLFGYNSSGFMGSSLNLGYNQSVNYFSSISQTTPFMRGLPLSTSSHGIIQPLGNNSFPIMPYNFF